MKESHPQGGDGIESDEDDFFLPETAAEEGSGLNGMGEPEAVISGQDISEPAMKPPALVSLEPAVELPLKRQRGWTRSPTALIAPIAAPDCPVWHASPGAPRAGTLALVPHT